jgi:CHRD domain
MPAMPAFRPTSFAVHALLAACAALFAGAATAADLKLTGDQEVPANTSTAVGTGTISVAADGSVSGSVTAPTLQVMAAHIHVGAAGVNGPVIIPLTGGPGGVWSVPAGAKLTAEQMESYKAGNLYVNIHTAEHKGGEIRTQLKP